MVGASIEPTKHNELGRVTFHSLGRLGCDYETSERYHECSRGIVQVYDSHICMDVYYDLCTRKIEIQASSGSIYDLSVSMF